MVQPEKLSALLLSKMGHDMASPLNALGLILETMQSSTISKDDLILAQASYQKLLNVFTFYRLLFSQAENNLPQILKFLEQELFRHNIAFKSCQDAVPSSFGKVFLCLYFLSEIHKSNSQKASFSIHKIDNICFQSDIDGLNYDPSSWIEMFESNTIPQTSPYAVLLFLKNYIISNKISLSFQIFQDSFSMRCTVFSSSFA